MTLKPNRTIVESTEKEKIRYRKRTQEEREAAKALKDFLLHKEQEEYEEQHDSRTIQDGIRQ